MFVYCFPKGEMLFVIQSLRAFRRAGQKGIDGSMGRLVEGSMCRWGVRGVVVVVTAVVVCVVVVAVLLFLLLFLWL